MIKFIKKNGDSSSSSQSAGSDSSIEDQEELNNAKYKGRKNVSVMHKARTPLLDKIKEEDEDDEDAAGHAAASKYGGTGSAETKRL